MLKHEKRINPAVYNTTDTDLKEDFLLDELALERKVDAYSFDYTENDILTFSFTEQTGAATINATAHTVDIEVANGTDETDLTPTLTVSEGATVAPASGAAQDFSSPVTYTVTAEDETEQAWTVTVTVAA